MPHVGRPPRPGLELVEREAVEGVHHPGRPARSAAEAAERPAFALCVCTTSKPPRVMSSQQPAQGPAVVARRYRREPARAR